MNREGVKKNTSEGKLQIKLVRILVLSNKCPPDYDGGYELSAFQVAGALRGRGYDVHLATSHFRPTFTGPRDSDPNWVHRIFDYLEWPKLTKSGVARFFEDSNRVADLTKIGVANAAKLHSFLDENSFDLAYCFGLHGIGLATASPLAKRKMPIVWHAGNYLIAQDMQLMSLLGGHRLAHRYAMHFLSGNARKMIAEGDYSHIAFLSEAMKREFVRMGYEPAHSYTIPRGIDFPLTEDVESPRRPVFLMASRIAAEKGYDVVLEACQILDKDTKGKEWRLDIAGSGAPEYITALKDKANKLGIGVRVRFLGMLKREEVLDEMRQDLAFISASLWEEPFGRTNIESLACGCVLIAAQTGAINEIVGDSGCAEIYPKTDATALSNAMRAVLENESKRADLAGKGIERIKQAYTIDRILDMTEDTFEKVMKEYGKPFTKPAQAGAAS